MNYEVVNLFNSLTLIQLIKLAEFTNIRCLLI